MARRTEVVLAAAFTAFAVQSATPAVAQTPQVQVVLAWDYLTPGASGFVLHCGLSTGSYSTRNDVGNTLSATLALIKGTVRFCAVTAYDAHGDESDFSNEVVISVTDAGSVGEELPLRVQDVEVTATGVRVRFNRRIDYGRLNLYSWGATGEGASDVALIGQTEGAVRGSLVVHPDKLGLTFVKSAGLLVPDAYELAIYSRVDGLLDELGRPIDGDGDRQFGDDYSLHFVVPPSSSPIVSIGEFARAPAQPVDLPLSEPGAGIPVSISNAAAVHDMELWLQFDPKLLALTDVQLAPGVGGQLTVHEINPSAGLAHIQIANLSGLPDTTTTLLSLRAAVPPDAQYRAVHILDIGSLRINGGALPGLDDDGLHVVALPGDASGNGSYTALDIQLMRRVTADLDTGFSAYPLADPNVVGDVSGDGALTSLDETGVVELCAADPAGPIYWNVTKAIKCSIILP